MVLLQSADLVIASVSDSWACGMLQAIEPLKTGKRMISLVQVQHSYAMVHIDAAASWGVLMVMANKLT